MHIAVGHNPVDIPSLVVYHPEHPLHKIENILHINLQRAGIRSTAVSSAKSTTVIRPNPRVRDCARFNLTVTQHLLRNIIADKSR